MLVKFVLRKTQAKNAPFR